MIKEMSATDWIRLISALSITGLLLYYNPELTKQATDLLSINDQFGFQYNLVQWTIVLLSTSFLGIALPRERFIQTMIMFSLFIGLQLIFQLINK